MRNKLNQKYFVLIGIIVFLLIIITVFINIIMPKNKHDLFNEITTITEIINDGDVICRLGDRFWSQIIKDISIEDKKFSHIGIVRIVNNQVSVIHAEGTTQHGSDFVKEESLDNFLKVAKSIGIYRVNNIDRNKISELAIKYIGVPFDWQFDMYDESKIYCTELLFHVLKQIEPSINLKTQYLSELKKDIIPIDSISNSDYFIEKCFY